MGMEAAMNTLMAAMLAVLVTGGFASAEEFGCNRGALNERERSRHEALSQALLASVQEHRELADGYAFRFPAETLVSAAEWVSLERKCCPFFTFELIFEENEGPIQMRLRGAEGVRDFIKAGMLDQLLA